VRVLVLTTEVPFPRDGGGRIRTFETLACLTEIADVDLLAVAEDPAADAAARELAAALPRLSVAPPVRHPVHIRRKPLALARTLAIGLLRDQPYLAAKYESRAYQAAAADLVARRPPDVIWCDHLNVFPAARRVAGGVVPLVLDEHNVESDLFRRAAGATGLLSAAARLEAGRAERFERAALAHANAVVAISEEDAVRLRELGGSPVFVVPPSIGERVPERAPPRSGPVVVFLASLSWPPNAEAARFLAREVLPRLRRIVPGAQLRIGGRGLASGLAAELAAAGAEVCGHVSDAVSFLRSGSVAAVAVLSGSGISIKTLDALAAGVPLVTTSVGARGLPLRDGVDALVADGADAFAAALARVLHDDAMAEKLVHGGLAYLSRYHVRGAQEPRYREVLERARASRIMAGRLHREG
jgi:glycosyltransferase involved in cell wall biosynthesis